MALSELQHTRRAARNLSAWSQWLFPQMLVVAFTTLLATAYYPAFSHLVSIWYFSSSFNHCFLIIPISAYVLWDRRALFATMTPTPSWWGVTWVAAAALVWMMGNFINVAALQHTGLVLMFMGFLLALNGVEAVRAGLFPFFYLLLMIPFGTFLSPILQDMTAHSVLRLLQVLRVPVYSDGLFFMLPSGNFEVAEACSGIKYQTAMFALGLLYANLMYRAFWRRAVFMALAILTPIVMNGIRAFGIMYISYITDNAIDIAHNHITYGQVLFGVAMLGLMWVGQYFSDADGPGDGAASTLALPTMPARAWLPVGLAVVAVMVAVPLYAHLSAPPQLPPGHAAPMSPPRVAGWINAGAPDLDDKPEFAGADQVLWASYQRGDQTVLAYAGWYDPVRDTADPLHYGNLFFSEKNWTRLVTERAEAPVGGRLVDVNQTRLRRQNDNRMVWAWYWVDGHVTPYDWMAKLYVVRARLLGHVPAMAAMAVMTNYADRPESAAARLAEFTTALPDMGGIAGKQE